jgi:hypothetical protein
LVTSFQKQQILEDDQAKNGRFVDQAVAWLDNLREFNRDRHEKAIQEREKNKRNGAELVKIRPIQLKHPPLDCDCSQT